MKKILSLLVAFVATATVTLAATTTTYNGNLTAIGEGEAAEAINGKQSDVKVYLTQNDDNTYTIELKNFYISMSGETFYIGNIKVPTLTATDANTLESKPKDGANNIILSDGDDPKDVYWWGSAIEGAQGDVKATLDGDNIHLAFPVSILVLDLVVDVDYSGTSTTPTAISSATVSTTSTSAVYNAAGQQVAPTAKGLVIKNGHKFINK